MPSLAKSQSARANGAKSRGPKTPAGRARSSLNALSHGLTSARLVLKHESQAEYQALRDAYFLEFAPRSLLEADLVDQLVAARWRLQRAWYIETAMLDLEILRQEPDVEKEFESISDETRIALGFRALCDDSRSFALLQRYEARHRRTFHRLLDILQLLKKGMPNEPNHDAPPPASVDENKVRPPAPAPPQTGPLSDPQPTTHSPQPAPSAPQPTPHNPQPVPQPPSHNPPSDTLPKKALDPTPWRTS